MDYEPSEEEEWTTTEGNVAIDMNSYQNEKGI